MEILRPLYVLVLATVAILAGCFGSEVIGPPEVEGGGEIDNLTPLVSAKLASNPLEVMAGDTLIGYQLNLYHSMTDWDGTIISAGWDTDLDGVIDNPVNTSTGVSTITIPVENWVDWSRQHLTSVAFSAVDDDGAIGTYPLLDIGLESPLQYGGTRNIYQAKNANSAISTGTNDTLIRITWTGTSDDLNWTDIEITLYRGGNSYTCEPGGEKCTVEEFGGDDAGLWEYDEIIYLKENNEAIAGQNDEAYADLQLMISYEGRKVEGTEDVRVTQ